MPTPTALLRRPEELAAAEPTPVSQDKHGDDILVDVTRTTPPAQEDTVVEHLDSAVEIDEEGRPVFPPAKDIKKSHRVEARKLQVPYHRMTALKSNWPKIYPPLVGHLNLQVRMNVPARAVEIRSSKYTTDSGALQKGEDFVRAFCLGFDLEDAIAMLRLDDLYIETYCLPRVTSDMGSASVETK
ncbi:MAG: pre-rRNA-processing protein pno1 [Alectoria fallacina]|uniref:Pre-rRNA-processing protein pno1 n=1 Tax=Alectoria fallacina TaxID=1903189 RepID=A0A8H3IUS5_9LECA|nr:MAG: pre-rRNA-processing protein pno1 [Alectoria fallacina]